MIPGAVIKKDKKRIFLYINHFFVNRILINVDYNC